MEATPRPGDQSGRAQVLNMIDYLAACDARKNPPVRDISDYKLFRLQGTELPKHEAVRVRPDEGTWLAVDFLDLPAAPTVPDDLLPAFVDDLRLDALSEPPLRPEPVRDAPTVDDQRTAPPPAEDVPAGGPTLTDFLSEQPIDPDLAEFRELVGRATSWIADVWRPWSDRWRSVSAVKKLHRDLFEQRELLVTDRDSVELIWGFGRLQWNPADGAIFHPLITVTVEIDVVPLTQQIRVQPAGGAEVENRFLQGLEIHDPTGYAAVRQAVGVDGAEMWTGEELSELVHRLVRSVDDEGVVVERLPATAPRAVADLGWTLYLRRRVPDSQGFLDAMRELYRDQEQQVPASLKAVMTSGDPGGTGLPDTSGQIAPQAGRESEPLLLPLPSNEEQERILRTAQRHPGVAVQGPPGTGKSHTIANLISHHVAYGRRVLVVAEKEQALKVLSDKVPPEIRDLTVSVLGADDEGRRRMESAIMQIQSRVGGLDKEHADAMITIFTDQLERIDRDLAITSTRMLRARRAETDVLPGTWRAGESTTPVVAAKWTTEHQDQYGYIPDPIAPTVPAPSGADLQEFRHLLTTIGWERAEYAGRPLPDLGALPLPSLLQEKLDLLARSAGSAAAVRPLFSDWTKLVSAGPTLIHAMISRLESEKQWRLAAERCWWIQVTHQVRDPLQAEEWSQFVAELEKTRTEIMAVRSRVRVHQIVILESFPELERDLIDARDRLKVGKIGLFARDAKHAVASMQFDGHSPTTWEEVDLCIAYLGLDPMRRRMLTLWSNPTESLRAPALAGLPEEAVVEALRELGAAVTAEQRWAERTRELADLGFERPTPPSPVAIDTLARTFTQALGHFENQSTATEIEDVRRYLDTGRRAATASPLWGELLDDLNAPDAGSWARHRELVAELTGIAAQAERLRALRDALRAQTPQWVQTLLQDPSKSGDPGDLSSAWEWRQLDTWVEGIVQSGNPGELQDRIEALTTERRQVVTQLVAERAWRRLADNLGNPQRQALNAYLKASSRFGKTGGKYAQRWITEMRVALDEAKTAVPVWIMPTAKALSSFRPSAVPPFDVLIVDEASQIAFEALPLLALASSTIVVGDDKQTSPENVGLDRQQVFSMMDDFLTTVPKYRTLFDPDNSLYDLAIQKFAEPVMLTEHFRCLPEIIAFSNVQAYNGLIIPLRDQPPAPGWAPLGLIRVLDGYRKGDVNEPEAAQVVALISRLMSDPAYDRMTFGVISLLGTSQSKRIWDLLYERFGPDIMRERRIRCGEAANFQGDERDVMVLSTVVAVDPANPTRIGAMTSTRDLRRINVAASRARNQMWVVTSVDAAQLPTGDLRAALIRHCADPGSLAEAAENVLDRCESDFERRVVTALLARGYRGVDVQTVVGRYRIDIVVNGPDGRLAIECDGDRWHGEDVWYKDRARQEVLERAGWSFERVRGSAFYRDPANAMDPVWDHLDKLGIPTGDEWLVDRRRSVIREVSGSPDDGMLPRRTDVADCGAEALTATVVSPIVAATEASGSRPRAVAEPMSGPAAGPARPVPEPVAAVAQAILAVAEPPGSVGSATPGEMWKPPSWYRPPNEDPPERVAADPVGEGHTGAGGPTGGADAAAPSAVRKGSWVGWNPRPLASVDSSSTAEVITGLRAIVAAEGPMHADRAYLL